jgi:hypothetical protein
MTDQTTLAQDVRPWGWVGIALIVLLAVGMVSAVFVITTSTGAIRGQSNGSTYLTHWQQTAVSSAATPNPLPAAVSLTVATPTRLAGVSASLRLDPADAAHQAVEWTFTESVGVPVNQEIEVAFAIEYTAGAVSHSVAVTAFLESQAAAIGGALTFNIYWDAGAAAGITFESESEISQACTAIGSCP